MFQPLNKIRFSRLLIYLTGLLIVVIFMALLSRKGDAVQSRFPPPSQGDTVDVAIEVSPYTYSLAGDTVAGMDYEALRQIAARHGLKVKFRPTASQGYALEGLKAGAFDIAIGTMPLTAELRKNFHTTPPLYTVRQVLVTLRDTARLNHHERLMRLMGDTVYVSASSPAVSRLRALGREMGDTIYIIEDTLHAPEQLAMLVGLGRMPRAVVAEGVAKGLASQFPDLDYSTPIALTQLGTWLVNPGQKALADSLTAWIDAYRGTPQYTRLLQHYGLRAPR